MQDGIDGIKADLENYVQMDDIDNLVTEVMNP